MRVGRSVPADLALGWLHRARLEGRLHPLNQPSPHDEVRSVHPEVQRPSNRVPIVSEFAAFLARAEDDPDALSAEERIRWDAYMTAVYRHFGNLVYASRVGTLDREMWEAYRATLKDHLRAPSWADWYRAHQHLFSTSLTELVELSVEELAAESKAV